MAEFPSQPATESEVQEKAEEALEELSRVIVHNDPITPMDYVVHILKTIFHRSNPAAVEIMMAAHFYGNAYVQSLPRAEATTRVDKAHGAARADGFPLTFTIEDE